jgi:RHS repeat-associated protein
MLLRLLIAVLLALSATTAPRISAATLSHGIVVSSARAQSAAEPPSAQLQRRQESFAALEHGLGGDRAPPGRRAPREWGHPWNLTGMLIEIQRPDGERIAFGYDPLARRVLKTYRGKTTRWIWDGNVPLHEWVELNDEALARDGAPVATSFEREIAVAKRKALLARRSAQGPPRDAQYTAAFGHDSLAGTGTGTGEPELEVPLLEGTPESPITWLFEPESFAPLTKLVADERYSIVTDHLGTPRAMYDAHGQEVWGADVDTYGRLIDARGPRRACPFRFPGQYEDAETGLYYNRFRYYDPESGGYVSQDPIRTSAGIRLHCYVPDPLTAFDPFGLSCTKVDDQRAGYKANLELHLELFSREGGGSWVMTKLQYQRFVEGNALVGDPSGQFIATKARMDRVLTEAGGDLFKVEKALGFDPGHFSKGQGLVRIDVPPESLRNFRTPSGLERGANQHFRYGGYTSGGVAEAVVDPVPVAQVVITQ